MEIIAKTDQGFLINASLREVRAILESVNGIPKEEAEIEIGQKIPAIDYASTIQKVKSLKDNYAFTQLFRSLEDFATIANGLKEVVNKASNIEE